MKKYVFESLKFFCAAILCTILTAFATPSWGALPSGYTELEYVNMPEGAYLLTDIVPTYDGHYELEFAPITLPSTGGSMMGGRSASYPAGLNLAWNTGNTPTVVMDGFSTNRYTGTYAWVMGTKYKYTWNNKVASISTGGSTVVENTFTGTNTNGGKLYINAMNNQGDILGNSATINVYSFSAWDSAGAMVGNFVPAKNSSGVIGMYDTVNNRFYTNAGTGEFIAGDPVTTCNGTIVNYTSATGTGVQSGTPTPDNPIYPTFYTQGNMVLRAVGDYKDTFDATTGKITRRVGVKVFDGTETDFEYSNGRFTFLIDDEFALPNTCICTHYVGVSSTLSVVDMSSGQIKCGYTGFANKVYFKDSRFTTAAGMQNWLAEQYAAGTPVTIYYPLATAVEENWTESQYCNVNEPIKIATTKYNESAFGPLNTALANAISVVDTVVSNTITQAGRIATLQAQKQTRPADDTCPAYKQCLLVEDENGKPHWYEITDPFRDFVAPIIANNVAPASTTNSAGYTQLEYIESTGTQWIDTGVVGNMGIAAEIKLSISNARTSWILGSRTGPDKRFGAIILTEARWDFGLNADNSFGQYVAERDYVINFVTNLNTPSTMSINDGNSIAVSEVNNTDLQLYLFNVNYNGTPTSGQGFIGKIYYSKIWNNNTLVRNMIPVRNNATGKYGLYDTVSRRFYGNAASSGDDFTAGPVVANTDVPANGTWTATWAANATTGVAAGTVYGEGLCNGVSGTNSTPATNEQTASANWNTSGVRCWCRATGVDDGNDTTTVDGVWVFYNTYGSSGDCATGCASACVEYVNRYTSFRSAVLGM